MSTGHPRPLASSDVWVDIDGLAGAQGFAVVYNYQILDHCRAAGVETRQAVVQGYHVDMAPEWAVNLWNACPHDWERLVLHAAQHEPETREALSAIVAMRPAGGEEDALRVWCWARWPEGPRAGCQALGLDPDEP